MLDKEHRQSIGNDSVGIQAEHNINIDMNVYNGLTYADVKTISLDVFEQNFYKLSNVAKETATLRVQELTDKFLNQLWSQNQSGISQVIDPDFQYDLFIAQRDYARCGDPTLSNMLVRLLIERTRETERSRLQIVLNESIKIVSKLTKDELNALTAMFVLEYYSEKLEFDKIADLANYITTSILPLWSSTRNENSVIAHLCYAGCGFHTFYATLGLEEFLRSRYTGSPIERFYDLKTSIENEDSKIKPFFDQFGTSIINHMTLTTVGIAIGYANLCNITGEEFNLSKWL